MFYNSFPLKLLLIVVDLQHSLSKVLTLQHSDQTLGGIINALGDVLLDLELAVGQPLHHVLLVLLGVVGAEAWVADDEALELQALADNHHQVGGLVLIFGLGVVVADHAALNETGPVVGVLDGSLELDAADVVVVCVETMLGTTSSHMFIFLSSINSRPEEKVEWKYKRAEWMRTDINAIRRQLGQCIVRVDLLVVESLVEAERLDVFNLLVAAD